MHNYLYDTVAKETTLKFFCTNCLMMKSHLIQYRISYDVEYITFLSSSNQYKKLSTLIESISKCLNVKLKIDGQNDYKTTVIDAKNTQLGPLNIP